MNSIEECLPSCIKEMNVTGERNDELSISSVISFSKDFPGFQGHFPGNPILPAIVQLSAVRYLAEKSFGKNLSPDKISRAKFRAMVIPEQHVHVELTLKNSEKGLQGKFKLRKADHEMISDGHILFLETNS